jgi:hypothetical protein
MLVTVDVLKDGHGSCEQEVEEVQCLLHLVWHNEVAGMEFRHEDALFFRYSLTGPSYLCPA